MNGDYWILEDDMEEKWSDFRYLKISYVNTNIILVRIYKEFWKNISIEICLLEYNLIYWELISFIS